MYFNFNVFIVISLIFIVIVPYGNNIYSDPYNMAYAKGCDGCVSLDYA